MITQRAHLMTEPNINSLLGKNNRKAQTLINSEYYIFTDQICVYVLVLTIIDSGFYFCYEYQNMENDISS